MVEHRNLLVLSQSFQRHLQDDNAPERRKKSRDVFFPSWPSWPTWTGWAGFALRTSEALITAVAFCTVVALVTLWAGNVDRQPGEVGANKKLLLLLSVDQHA